MRVAIIGSARTSLKDVPWGRKDMEYWCLAWRVESHAPHRIDRAFEIHKPPWRAKKVGPEYEARLVKHDIPIICQEHYPHIPKSEEFPHQEVAMLGRDYLTSSVAYMLAYAIVNGVKRIEVYGIDLLTDGEYAEQRPCAEYWLGVARGKGIEVYIPPTSALLRSSIKYGTDRPGDGGAQAFSEQWFQSRVDEYDAHFKECEGKLHTFNGARQECEHWMNLIKEQHLKTPHEFLEELAKVGATRHGQFQKELHIGEAQKNTYAGALQESKACLDFQRTFNRGGVVPGVDQGAVNAAVLPNGEARGSNPKISPAHSPKLVGVGVTPEADTGGDTSVPTGFFKDAAGDTADPGAGNGHAGNGVTNGAVRGPSGPRLVRDPGGQEGTEEGTGAIRHTGGPWYEVDGKKYRGLKAAEEALSELN